METPMNPAPPAAPAEQIKSAPQLIAAMQTKLRNAAAIIRGVYADDCDATILARAADALGPFVFWDCETCKQRNSWWATSCGRCGNTRDLPKERNNDQSGALGDGLGICTGPADRKQKCLECGSPPNEPCRRVMQNRIDDPAGKRAKETEPDMHPKTRTPLAGECGKLFSTCTSGPDRGFKTYCVLSKGHADRCSNAPPPQRPTVAEDQCAECGTRDWAHQGYCSKSRTDQSGEVASATREDAAIAASSPVKDAAWESASTSPDPDREELVRHADMWLVNETLGTHWPGCEDTHWKCLISAMRTRIVADGERIKELMTALEMSNQANARLAHVADKYKWQVRDTCTRAERAEAEVARLTKERNTLAEKYNAVTIKELGMVENKTPDLAVINGVCDEGQLSDARWDADSAEVDRDAYKARAERAEVEVAKLRRVVKRAHAVMHGNGVEDQGQAWDECVRVLDAAIAALDANRQD